MSRLKLDYNQVDTGSDPKVSIIWMHGLGDHGSSFVPLVQYFDLANCPPVRFIFPHAPERPVTVNAGYEMRAWFDIYGGFDASDAEDSEGVQESRRLITDLINQEKARGVPTEKIILAGFSQGCAMALYTALCSPEKMGGVIGLSGYIPLIRQFPDDRSPVNQDTPIFLAHGEHDEVVPFNRAEDARELLGKLGYRMEWHAYPITHTLSLEELNDVSAWLRRILA
ncbi:MAG: dienelactone hydrolase family protein [Burkholderiaceae bacterium]|jgi:phospholipase/carboxylesterase|nr:dienelactone hydrolase family protein [Burkholderiaceae bacterium]